MTEPKAERFLINTGSGAAWSSRDTLEKAVEDAKTAHAWAVANRGDFRPYTIESTYYDLDRGRWITLDVRPVKPFTTKLEARTFLRLFEGA